MKLLEIKDLSKSFGGLMAVNSVDLEIRTGEIVGLIGPNGAGKTTLFSLISGFIKPTGGEIHFLNQPIHEMKCHSVCQIGIGRTFQIVQPFPEFTTLENVMVGAFNRTQHVHAAEAKAVEICDFIGLGHLKDTKAGNLNLADKKHLEIARALATEPKLLLLDEVMAGLNATEVSELVELVKRIHANGVTIFVIEHVMRAIIELSQRIVVLNYGQKIADGLPEEISEDQKVIEAYLGEIALV